MKLIHCQRFLVLAFLVFAGLTSEAQQSTVAEQAKAKVIPELHTYLIERNIPGAGNLTAEQLKSISQTSCTVLKEMGPKIQWLHSYVTGDKVFCVYKAENEELLREHAKKGGFPVNSITRIKATISPATTHLK